VRNEFRTPATARRAAEQFLHQHELQPAQPLLFIQPFTSTPLKNWPLANYLAVAHTVRTQGGQVLFGGGPRDEALLEPARQQGFAVAAGQPLLTMAGLMQHAALVLGSDTGLLHRRSRRAGAC
jgi:ADP-heptose:LPS heptosyltransferase